MNKIIEQLQNRKSVRSFTGEKIKDEDIEIILKTAQRAANSVNGQQVSLMVVRDKEILQKISELCENQGHIATADTFILILMDFYRGSYAAKSVGKDNIGAKSADGIFVGAIDSGIMLNAIQTAAEGLGYGTTAIGAVRNSMEEFIKLFELPEGVFPMVGTTIGVPVKDNKSLKPRVPLNSFAFYNKYDGEKVKEGVEIHEVEIKKWREETGTSQLPSYKEMIVRVYENLRYDKVNEVLEKQGFKFTDNPDNI